MVKPGLARRRAVCVSVFLIFLIWGGRSHKLSQKYEHAWLWHAAPWVWGPWYVKDVLDRPGSLSDAWKMPSTRAPGPQELGLRGSRLVITPRMKAGQGHELSARVPCEPRAVAFPYDHPMQ